MKILLDAGIVIADGNIKYAYRAGGGDYVNLTFADTPENRGKLEQFFADRGLEAGDIRFPRAHLENRELRRRIAEDGTTTNNSDSPKPQSQILREYLAERRERTETLTFEERIERQIEDAEVAEEMAELEAQHQSRAAAAVEHASYSFLELAFDSNAPQSEVAAAAHRLNVARKTPDDYPKLDAEYRVRVRHNAELQKLNFEGQLAQQREAFDRQIQQLDSAAWVAPPTTTEEQN